MGMLAPQGAGCVEPAVHRIQELALPGTGGLLLEILTNGTIAVVP
jgi:hypothetical protein